ncbi:GH17048 [Drosophila grimshawi]|uniref:GH17048 n=1 Tax=Drosophila grimshawi TaxID=7222 RepID=B4IZJ3_DROGR|nr:GH17048 [Drosophila grimshawi]
MSAIPQTDNWIDFFKVYRQLPALWSVYDEVYKNQRMKKLAFNCLLECYKKIDSKANVDSMRRKINSIRTCFRRELRKVEQSEQMAESTHEVYVPHLWYFNELSFLRGHDARTPQLASLAETSDMFWNDDDHDENESKNELNDDKDNDSEKESKVNLRDEADIYAEGWATSYRKLDQTNKLLAKKAIEEILVLGQLNQLEFNSVKMPNSLQIK